MNYERTNSRRMDSEVGKTAGFLGGNILEKWSPLPVFRKNSKLGPFRSAKWATELVVQGQEMNSQKAYTTMKET
ncbi:hypothetical protein [Bacteroides thetaiotaomicron]|uniref:hypothetical protein n=1 Tax=Bacteroides thetaiotaomicron TaxID=818 RepID=UPI0021660C94|nr:hypothetical protein [Bacteroides thetaiotaomicron]MCS2598630.1 hypothetical protein [Bacteroides thetaiotaomicron]